ncbi:uncharacterized protein LOC109808289 [Cajanus cajan]|nr:uncharacterized protein LOC109808289 [Cajanus cajan]
MGRWVGDNWCWDFQWRRNMFEWERAEWLEVESRIQNIDLRMGNLDCWEWIVGDDKIYTVKSAYKVLHYQKYGSEQHSLITSVWKLNIPPKGAIVVWQIFMNSLATCDNLLQRNIILPELESICKFCNEETESTSHVLFTCKVSDWLWKKCYNWASVSTVLSALLTQHFGKLPYSNLSAAVSKRWRVIVWCAIMWLLLGKRNNCGFKSQTCDIQLLYVEAQRTVWSWLRMEKNFKYTYMQWVVNSGACISN